MAIYDGFESVIGLEVHAQLLTKSKIFCGCRVAFGEKPNSLTCPVCLGLPGALPVLNREAVELALRMILAVEGEVGSRSVFARKNYFYPDLPKGYQISQFDKPIGIGGNVAYLMENGCDMTCALIRIHLEEDAGKLLHPAHDEPYSRVDLNRCGTPLIEIVSKPDIRSPEQAYRYLSMLKQILQYAGVSSADMEKGQLRCDANVSLRPEGQKELGTRTEIKNLNSFRGVERALHFEIKRQVELLQSGGQVEQMTLLWDDNRQMAEPMRTKADAQDYRYFPEPDLVELVIPEDWIEKSRQLLPELPRAKAKRFIEQFNIKTVDAFVLTESKELAEYFEEVTGGFDDYQAAANWIRTELVSKMHDSGLTIGQLKVSSEMLAALLGFVRDGEISGKIAKRVFAEMFDTGRSAAEIIKERGLVQISDDKQLIPLIDKVIAENQENVAKYRAGKTKVFGHFVGEVMKVTKGQANPQLVNKLLKERLDG